MSAEPIIHAVAPLAATAPAMARGRLLGAYLQEARSECLRYLRLPSFLVPTLLFPAVFYLMFGVFLGARNGPDAARYLLAAYSTFGVMAPGLFGFGVSLALERDGGLLTLKRALPMPPSAYLLGKMVMAMAVAAALTVLLMSLAIVLAQVPLSIAQAARLLATGILAVLPFSALGLLIGTLVRGQGAPGMVNLVYLPMSFASGLWFPLAMLPAPLRALAPLWPSYHVNQLAQAALGFDVGTIWPHVVVLAAMTVALVGWAARRLRRVG